MFQLLILSVLSVQNGPEVGQHIFTRNIWQLFNQSNYGAWLSSSSGDAKVWLIKCCPHPRNYQIKSPLIDYGSLRKQTAFYTAEMP